MSAMALLEEAKRLGMHLEAAGDALRIRAPKGSLTTEIQSRLKHHKSSLISLLRPTAENTARIVQQKLLAGEPVRIRMGDIGEAYWVATETQRDDLVAELTASSDNTPVYCWGELVRISGWNHSDKLVIYQAKRLLRVTLEPVDPDPTATE